MDQVPKPEWSVMAAASGWYADPENPGTEWFWDGGKYTESRKAPLFSFAGKINGQKTKTSIYEDRVEWSWSSSKGVSGGKIAAGIFTAGLSLAATGVGKGSYGIQTSKGGGTIRLADVTSVTFKTAGGDSVVTIGADGVFFDLAVPRAQSQQIVSYLSGVAEKSRKAEATAMTPSVTVNVSAGPSDEAAIKAAQLSALSSPDLVANLEKLANMRFQHLISDEEYDLLKAKLLGG